MNVKDIATNTKETINYKFKQDTCKKAMKPLIGHTESEVDCEQYEDIKHDKSKEILTIYANETSNKTEEVNKNKENNKHNSKICKTYKEIDKNNVNFIWHRTQHFVKKETKDIHIKMDETQTKSDENDTLSDENDTLSDENDTLSDENDTQNDETEMKSDETEIKNYRTEMKNYGTEMKNYGTEMKDNENKIEQHNLSESSLSGRNKIPWNKMNTFKIGGNEISGSSDGYFHCSFCDKKYKSPADMKIHIVTHTGQRDYQCNVCLKSFGRVKTMRKHLNMHNEFNVQCPNCEKKFSHETNLKNHIKRFHDNSGGLVCSFCSQSFKCKGNLKIHERKHTGDFPFQCDQCNEKFREKRNLNSHGYKEHSVPKPHICQTCGKGFVINSKLEKHMAVHSDEKKFKCDECDATFQIKTGLLAHRVRHKVKTGDYSGAM